MADKDDAQKSDDFTSTARGAETNEPVTGDQFRPAEQTPDQFFDPQREQEARDRDVPANHATKGMTSLGYAEASRIENTAELQEKERKAFERRAAREAQKED
jgi:hypothetical protein